MHRKSFALGLGGGFLLCLGVVSMANMIGRQVPNSPPSAVVSPVAPVIQNGKPPHWQEREFNGRPYYIVPLHKGES